MTILIRNDYVFRNKERSNKREEDNKQDDFKTRNVEIKSQVLTTRLKSLVRDEGYEGVGIQKPQITVKTLNASGMLNELKILRETKDEITEDDFRDIVMRFNNQEYSSSSLKSLYYFMLKRDMKFIRTEE